MLDNQILAEVQNAVREKGADWVLAYLKGRNGDSFIHTLIRATCAEFGITKTELIDLPHGADARRVLAEIMAENGYKALEVGRTLNKSRQAVVRYLSFMAYIKNERIVKKFTEILTKKEKIYARVQR